MTKQQREDFMEFATQFVILMHEKGFSADVTASALTTAIACLLGAWHIALEHADEKLRAFVAITHHGAMMHVYGADQQVGMHD